MYFSATRQALFVLMVPLIGAGCGEISNAWWNAFLDPTQTGNFRENVVLDIQRTISFRDTPIGIAGAEDPKPDDLVALVEEYEVGPGDTVQIRLLDFVQLNAESELVPTIDELGFIDLPQLGYINVEGMTAREIQSDIIQRAKTAGIYLEEDEPTVTVRVVDAQQRLFNLSGSVLYPGPYRIPRPDFRLREAINLGGNLDENAKAVYVYRNAPREKQLRERSVRPTGPTSVDHESLPPPPVSPVSMAELGNASGSGGTAVVAEAPTEAPSSGQPPTQPVGAEQDLIEALAPESVTRSQTAPAAAPGEQPGKSQTPEEAKTTGGLPSYIFVNDRFIEAPATQPAEPFAGPSMPAMPTTTQAVDWEELAAEGQQRIIRIPAEKLRNGDPAYDIVIRHQDWVRIDPGPVGLYYMSGHVQRPGPYALSGEQITLTQAIAAAGGLDAVAWPTRCEIRRRLDLDREEITQWDMARILDGKDPDLYLKPNDVVHVGTHAIAPLLATIRNSFRLTYGFGFVYDRNFADIDSYGGDINPDLRRRSELQQRFPGLFP